MSTARKPSSGDRSRIAAADDVLTAVPRRDRGPLWARWCVAVGILLLVASSGSIAAGSVLLHRYETAVNHDDLLPGPTAAGRGTDISGPLDVLLVGSDYRKDLGGSYWRSDTIIMIHIPASYDRAYLISIPRDLRVTIPDSGTDRWRGGVDKINAAYSHGGNGAAGFQLLARTLSDLTGVSFEIGTVIDFYGFTRTIEILGGIDICLDHEVRSIHTKRVFPVGCQHLDQHAALDLARQRYSLPSGDWDRQHNQQKVIKAVLQKATDTGMVRDPVRLDALVRALGGSLTADTGGRSTTDLAFALRRVKPANLVAFRLPSTGGFRDGNWYAETTDDAASMFQAIRDGTLGTWAAAHPKYVNPL